MRTDGTSRIQVVDDDAEEINVVGDWMYYIIYGGSGGIYKIRTDGTMRTNLEGSSMRGIVVLGDWIYYHGPSYFYKIRTDGSAKTKIGNFSPVNINIVNDWIYYISRITEAICKIRIDGSGATSIISGGNVGDGTLNVAGDWMYYRGVRGEDAGIFRMKTDGSDQQHIRGNCNNIIVIGDWVYFTANDEKSIQRLYRIKIDDSGLQKLGDDIPYTFNIAGDWVYYSTSDSRKLYRIKSDGSGRQALLASYTGRNFSVAGDWLYYLDFAQLKFCRIKTDGTGKEIL